MSLHPHRKIRCALTLLVAAMLLLTGQTVAVSAEARAGIQRALTWSSTTTTPRSTYDAALATSTASVFGDELIGGRIEPATSYDATIPTSILTVVVPGRGPIATASEARTACDAAGDHSGLRVVFVAAETAGALSLDPPCEFV